MKDEEERISRTFDKLNEEKEELEAKIIALRSKILIIKVIDSSLEDNIQLKEEMDLNLHKADEFDGLKVEYEKLEQKYKKLQAGTVEFVECIY